MENELKELKSDAILDTFYAFDTEYVVLNNKYFESIDAKNLLILCKVNNDGVLENLTDEEYDKARMKYRELQDLFNI